MFSLARAQGAFEAPIAGYFMDRFGPRPLMIMAIVMTSIGHVLLSGVHSYIALLLVYMGVVSLSYHAGFMDAPMVVANNWFIRRRTLASRNSSVRSATLISSSSLERCRASAARVMERRPARAAGTPSTSPCGR